MRSYLSRSFIALAISVAVSVHGSPLSTDPLDELQQRSHMMAPIIEAEHPYGTINNSYIVVFKDNITPALMYNHLDLLARVQDEDRSFDEEDGLRHVYEGVIKGYAGRFSHAVLRHIRSMPEVNYVERDQIVSTQQKPRQQVIQYGAPWVSFP